MDVQKQFEAKKAAMEKKFGLDIEDRKKSKKSVVVTPAKPKSHIIFGDEDTGTS